MGRSGWIIFIVIVVGLLGGLIVYSRLSNPSIDTSQINEFNLQAASEENGDIADHTYDASDGKVTLIEYGDFQCPYCGQSYPQIKSVLEEYGDVVTFIFRNFPITSAHPNAKAASAAAEAVGLQSSELYWKMHDAIFENQSQWSNLSTADRGAMFAQYASLAGADMDAYNAALADGAVRVNKKIAYDLAIANKQGITSTPTFFLNGEKLGSDISSDLQRGTGDELRKVLDEALKKAGLEVPKKETES